MESADIDVQGFAFNTDVLSHIDLHEVAEADLHEVLGNAPEYFVNPPVPGRNATHVVVGANREGRFLFIAISATEDPGIW